MTENFRYYYGFEGEPEYAFCLYAGNCPVEKIHLWDGYFSDIIRTVATTETGGQVLLNIISFVSALTMTTGKFLIFIRFYSG